jgi:hypothetical protein
MPKLEELINKVVETCRKSIRTATAPEIAIGQAVHRAIIVAVAKVHTPGDRRSKRAEVLLQIGERLQSEGIKKMNLNRSVQVCQVAQLFGSNDAKQLRLDTVAGFARLIKRNAAKEAWSIKAKSEEPARALWAQVVSGDVQPSAVRAAVDSILGTKPKAPRAPKAKPSPRQKLKSGLAAISHSELTSLLEDLRAADLKTFRKLVGTVKQFTAKKKPRPDSVETPTEPEPVSVLEKLGRRRGKAA